jgi:hypothetical protein
LPNEYLRRANVFNRDGETLCIVRDGLAYRRAREELTKCHA